MSSEKQLNWLFWVQKSQGIKFFKVFFLEKNHLEVVILVKIWCEIDIEHYSPLDLKFLFDCEDESEIVMFGTDCGTSEKLIINYMKMP